MGPRESKEGLRKVTLKNGIEVLPTGEVDSPYSRSKILDQALVISCRDRISLLWGYWTESDGHVRGSVGSPEVPESSQLLPLWKFNRRNTGCPDLEFRLSMSESGRGVGGNCVS